MAEKLSIEFDNIVFALQSFGGISNYWARLLNYVTSQADMDVRLLQPKYMRYQEYEAQALHRLPARHETYDPRVMRYLRAANTAADGVFHTSYYRLPQLRPRRYVVTVHDFTYERYRSGLARCVHSAQKFASLRRADTVLCVSESTRRDVLEFCPDVDPARLHVTHLGVDGSVFFPDPLADLTQHSRMVLFVGRRGGYKRFDLAVEAIGRATELSLGIVGPSLTAQEKDYLQKHLGIRWTEFGPVSTVALRRLYSSAYAFIFPSDYEGFGLPILEAMACGCPVVAANLSSLPEVGGDQAIYAREQCGESYAQALHQIADAQIRASSIQGGIQRAAGFDWIHTMQKTKRAYVD